MLSDRLGSDMSVYPLDAPVPDLPETEHLKSRAALLLQMARREKLTLRQLFYRVAAARGHLLLVASPVQIADTLEAWFRAGAADGFRTSTPPFSPASSTISPSWSYRSCRSAGFSGRTMRGQPCATISGWSASLAAAPHPEEGAKRPSRKGGA